MLRRFIAVGLVAVDASHARAADDSEWMAHPHDGKTARFRNLRVKELP